MFIARGIHQITKAPEGRQVYSTRHAPNTTKPQRGDRCIKSVIRNTGALFNAKTQRSNDAEKGRKREVGFVGVKEQRSLFPTKARPLTYCSLWIGKSTGFFYDCRLDFGAVAHLAPEGRHVYRIRDTQMS